MTKVYHWLLIILIILLACNLVISIRGIMIHEDSSIYLKYDSLHRELVKERLKRDSVVKDIQDSESRVDTIIKWYERKKTDIYTQSTDADMQFFADYLSSEAE